MCEDLGKETRGTYQSEENGPMLLVWVFEKPSLSNLAR
jgi:hypothetical protein